jgi:hypothetical protein
MRRVEQRISLVTLGVMDLSRARSFYEALRLFAVCELASTRAPLPPQY